MTELKRISLAVVTDLDTVLLVQRRAPEALADGSLLSWAFPGGKREPGEESDETAIRETLEETGRIVVAHTLIHQGQHPTAPVFASYWACELQAQEEVTSDPAIAAVEWVAIKSLDNYLTSALNPKDAAYLDQII